MSAWPDDRVPGAMAELRKTKETADRLANGDSPDDADQIRVLAGLVRQLAEQVERLVTGQAAAVRTATAAPAAERDRAEAEAEATVEEDRTPERAPAEPLNDRSKSP
jgi:hypothetical protein